MRVFNILRRWLFVLVCFGGSVVAMDFAKEDSYGGVPVAKAVYADSANKKTEDFESILDNKRTELAELISKYPDASHVVFFGDTGAGKTTLANLLKGEVVVAEEIDGDILLVAPGIHHGVGSGTKQICCYYSESDNTCYWDLPGLRDSNGWEKDTFNAILRKQLFDSLPAAKLVVVAKKADITGRATNFGALLKYTVDVFPEDDLQLCSYLAVTQGKITNMQAFLNGILGKSESDIKLSDRSVNDLLTFIANNTALRTSNFSEPSDIGEYGVDVTQEMLDNLKSVEPRKLVYKAILQSETCLLYTSDAADE